MKKKSIKRIESGSVQLLPEIKRKNDGLTKKPEFAGDVGLTAKAQRTTGFSLTSEPLTP